MIGMDGAVDAPLTLEDLARCWFSDLTEAELRLIRAAQVGKIAEYSPNSQDLEILENDLAHSDSWGEERKIRADVIRWLCVDGKASLCIDARGLQAHAARITGDLDLSFASVRFPLNFFQCSFSGAINLAHADLKAFNLSGTRTRTLTADGIKVGSGFFLRNGFSAEGAVRLVGADISGDLDCSKGSFNSPHQIALNIDHAQVKGNVFLRNCFNAIGEVCLLGADVSGDLDCSKGSFNNPRQIALTLDRAQVRGTVFLNDGFNALGEVRLLGSDISGDLDCGNGCFNNPCHDALTADSVKVGRNVILGNGFSAKGEVRLLGADIGLNLDCAGGNFDDSGQNAVSAHCTKVREHNALSADGAKVGGDVVLKDDFSAKGKVRLTGVDIKGDLSLTNANLTGTVLAAQRTRVRGTLFILNVKEDATTAIDLKEASASNLADDQTSWHNAGRLVLDGFVYDSISTEPIDATSRLNWLRRSMSVGRYRAQPYQQLAKVLREQGHEAESVAILVAMEDDRRKYGTLSWYQWFRACVLKVTIVYGYRPMFALVWILALMAFGFVVFGMGYRAGLMVPSDKDAYARFAETGRPPSSYEPFCAVAYSFNTFVPLIDLGQKGFWRPSPIRTRRPEYSSDTSITRLLCDAAFLDFPLRHMRLYMKSSLLSLCPALLSIYRWLHMIFGWFFTTMFVAGITGLIRH
jgi:hypothetical protein